MVLIAYSNTFKSSFHFDDNPSIVENPTDQTDDLG